jgi:hypothetical protein
MAELPSVVYAPCLTFQSAPRPVVRPKLSEKSGGTTGGVGLGGPVKVVVTVAGPDMTMVHWVGVPVTGAQLELNPANVEPASGAAVRVTVLPLLNKELALGQVGPQEIPAGLDVTVPLPVPALETVSGNLNAVNVVVTVAAADMVIVHWVGMPETGVQLELKLVKFEFASGAAVRVTTVPVANWKEHADPQEIPAGLEVTVPPPVPALEAVSTGPGGPEKFAVTVAAADMAMVH